MSHELNQLILDTEPNEFEPFLPKPITGVTLRVIDSETNNPIGGATATIRKNGIPLALGIADSNGKIKITW